MMSVLDGYHSIKPYGTRPRMDSVAARFLQAISESKKEWVPTSDLHYIYHSIYGSHVNVLIKLAKSEYLEVRKASGIRTKLNGRVYEKTQLLWKITRKGQQFVKKYCFESFGQKITYWRERLRRYSEKHQFPFIEAANVVTVRTPDKSFEFDLEQMSESQMMQLYSHVSYGLQCSGKDRKLFEEAEQWLNEHPDLKTEIITPIGTLCLVGNIRSNWVELNGARICIIPDKPVHRADIYICRLLWLNLHTDVVLRIAVRSYIKECPKCHEEAYFVDSWKYCPYCGSLIEQMIEDIILRKIPLPKRKPRHPSITADEFERLANQRRG